jgi:thiol-disulfide isomerase/thioredoxin
MNDQFGKPVSLSDFRDKVVLLDFWATWCPPCREAMPEVKKVWEKYRDRDFMIIGVSLDFDRDLDEWRDYISTNDLGWTHVADGRYWNNAVARQYDVTAIPEMKLLDREGNIIATSHSIRRLDSLILKELEKQ